MNKREWMLQAALAIPQKETDGTTDHVERLSYLYDKIVAATPEEPAWIEHHGAKPYPEGMVDVELRSGSQYLGMDSDEWLWTHDPDAPEGDIIRWRPA